MAWPLSQDYNEAVQAPHLCFADDELRAGQAATNALGLPVPRSGNFADGNLTPEKKVKGRIDYQVDFNWGFGSPDPEVPVDNFSVRWQGYLHAPRPGRYTLVVHPDDGARLFLDDRLVLDAWGEMGRHTVDVSLDEKAHLLRLDYHENTGAAVMWFHWIPEDGSPEQPVPFEALYHDLKQERWLSK
jgi:PA14 domain-containing protein